MTTELPMLEVSPMAAKPRIAVEEGWPVKMDRQTAARYLKEKHAIPTTAKTLANWMAAERGPKIRYLGTKPFYDIAELDRWAKDEAWNDESPARRAARL